MAGKPKNRLELRRQYEAAEPLDPMEDDDAEDMMEEPDEEEASERKAKKKPKASKAKSAKAPKPAARMRVVWTVVNDAFKPVATFEYSQKDAAYARAAELTSKGKGTHFVQRVKEPMPDNAPGLGATATALAEAAGEPKAKPAKPKATRPTKAAKKASREDDELPDDEELEMEEDEEEDVEEEEEE